MFTLIALSTLSSLAVIALVGDLVDLWDRDDAEETVRNVDNSGGFALLDEGLPADLQAGAMTEVAAGEQLIDANAVRDDYAPTGSVEIEGSEGDDFIDAGLDVEVTFGGAGDDVVFGADHAQVIFGDDGADVIFAEAGADQVHGDSGDDTLVGGAGGDLIVGGQGADVIFGGTGSDTIYTAQVYGTQNAPGTFDVVSAGAGEDVVYVTQGTGLIALGEGEDDVMIYSEFDIDDNHPVAIITDFQSGVDEILIGVHAPAFVMPADATTQEIGYTLTRFETADGPATLVVPAVSDQAMLDDFEGANIGHAVLLGVTPDQVAPSDIRVIVTNDASTAFAADSIQSVFAAQSVGAAI